MMPRGGCGIADGVRALEKIGIRCGETLHELMLDARFPLCQARISGEPVEGKHETVVGPVLRNANVRRSARFLGPNTCRSKK